jgi:hypothetical protein
MPAKVLKTAKRTVTLDARPDRPDIRDRFYAPPLRSLPPQYPPPQWLKSHLPKYVKAKLVLDQGAEGACTGFGLAAVINYLLYRQSLENGGKAPPRVSTRMIYHLARKYDEWRGEDYDGSSCRGAIKGWFHHGVCTEAIWPYRNKAGAARFVAPSAGWDADAAQRPVGAYYRILTEAISDLQAAINEVGAIYVSSDVHKGWDAIGDNLKSLPTIPWKRGVKADGGHAYALVGYDRDGFILQNSWGPKWGYLGFARITYEDWLTHADDAWVAVMGAPISAKAPPIVLSSSRTVPKSAEHLGAGLVNGATAAATAEAPRSNAWDTVTAVDHAVILGNDGLPDHISVVDADASAAVERACHELPKAWLTTPRQGGRRVAIYAHGGLNDLNAGLARIKVMGPWFEKNGIYPIFIVWQSGYFDAVKDIISDEIGSLSQQVRDRKTLSLLETLSDARDRLLEQVAVPAARPVWSQMKQNAEAASVHDGGMVRVAHSLKKLAADLNGLEIHLIGHSAGSIVLGAFLSQLGAGNLKASTVSLYAPACTVEFANSKYVPAATNGIYDPKRLFIDILSNKNERDDTVGPYGKSLLYLVSRALESRHKTPILGMEATFDPKLDKEDIFASSTSIFNPAPPNKPHPDVVAWRKAWAQMSGDCKVLDVPRVVEQRPAFSIRSVHGCFDNWIDGVERTMKRILGLAQSAKLPTPIETLKGF